MPSEPERRPGAGLSGRRAIAATAEGRRLAADEKREKNWKRWGTYLAERQWATVREDYSPDGEAWDYFTHDHARLRAYRWGEDGLLGWTDRECRLCFAFAFWNERDPFLKERLFGLTNAQGNHGEDVKELYYYLDAIPTHSYCRALYKYPQAAFPYERLVRENQALDRSDREFEIEDTGVFDGGRYFDLEVEYAKAGDNDILVRLTVHNRGSEAAPLHVLPTLWFRNTWIWGCRHEGCTLKPRITPDADGRLTTEHETLGQFDFAVACDALESREPDWLLTENITNTRAFGWGDSYTPYVKDAFHRYVVEGQREAVNPQPGRSGGTKAAAHLRLSIPPGGSATVRCRLWQRDERDHPAHGPEFERVFADRKKEADEFYDAVFPSVKDAAQREVVRQSSAGLIWSKQFYHYSVSDWLRGDPDLPAPPAGRWHGRNTAWQHVFNRDVISMPDKWEYPWFAAWDLAFHMIPFAGLDPAFAKSQLVLFLREWYLHPNGQLPAYEYELGDVNPPVHAWACWRVYKMTGERGARDLAFLERAFHKLLINFTWWVNRKDPEGNNIFAGGFLGLDNIGVFDRSKPLPSGGRLNQADGTAWMAFYCTTMLAIALELATNNIAYSDVASKFFEHFVAIADAMNTLGGDGLWDEEDGFYYDQLATDGHAVPLRVRSMVGIIPLFAVEILTDDVLERLPGFRKRMNWFLDHRGDLARQVAYMEEGGAGRHLLAIPSRERLGRVLRYVLDPEEFLSPFGVRSLSRVHGRHPFELRLDGEVHRVTYVPGESDSWLFGGNSNWRGPVWLPVNYLLIEALERYHHFYGDAFKIEYPVGSGVRATLAEVACDLSRRLASLFIPESDGGRPCHGADTRYAGDEHFRSLLLFHEYFDGETGRGCGASHQTGWTALVAKLIADLAAHDS